MGNSIHPQDEAVSAAGSSKDGSRSPEAAAGEHIRGAAELSTRAHVRLANQSWEAIFSAVVQLERRYTAAGLWGELTEREYDVLYTISKARGPLRISDIQSGVKLSQPGLSRMLVRLESRGLLERVSCPNDGRASLLQLTAEGEAAWRQTGRKLAREVEAAMSALSPSEQQQLRKLCEKLLAAQ